MVVPEGVVDDGMLRPRALFYAVAGGYFEATGIRLRRGRFIDRGDVERGAPVAVVNTALAEGPLPESGSGDPRERRRDCDGDYARRHNGSRDTGNASGSSARPALGLRDAIVAVICRVTTMGHLLQGGAPECYTFSPNTDSESNSQGGVGFYNATQRRFL
jgi:hypothetical protein